MEAENIHIFKSLLPKNFTSHIPTFWMYLFLLFLIQNSWTTFIFLSTHDFSTFSVFCLNNFTKTAHTKINNDLEVTKWIFQNPRIILTQGIIWPCWSLFASWSTLLTLSCSSSYISDHFTISTECSSANNKLLNVEVSQCSVLIYFFSHWCSLPVTSTANLLACFKK